MENMNNANPEVQTQQTEQPAPAPAKAEKVKNPHLFCQITGKSRATTWAYLKDKAARLANGSTAESLVENYISREAVSLLLAGNTVAQIRAKFPESSASAAKTHPDFTPERLQELVRMNSKAKKAADKLVPTAPAATEPTAPTAQEPAAEAQPEAQPEVVATAEVEVAPAAEPEPVHAGGGNGGKKGKKNR